MKILVGMTHVTALGVTSSLVTLGEKNTRTPCHCRSFVVIGEPAYKKHSWIRIIMRVFCQGKISAINYNNAQVIIFPGAPYRW